jgi:uncharacterized protein (DUF433 family)
MANESQYKYLGPRYGSSYQQYFVKGRRIRAEVLYDDTLEPEARTPEEVAADYDVPVEAVYEAIRYCQENEDVLDRDREMELASIRAHGWDKPPHAPPDSKPE